MCMSARCELICKDLIEPQTALVWSFAWFAGITLAYSGSFHLQDLLVDKGEPLKVYVLDHSLLMHAPPDSVCTFKLFSKSV